MLPPSDVSRGVAAEYCSVMYGLPGTSGLVNVDDPVKNWTVTRCKSYLFIFK